jgi:hypothetical protein
VGFAATFLLCSVAIAAASDEPTNMAKSVERKLQAIYDVVSPAVVKMQSDATGQRMVAAGVIVSPEGHVLLQRTLELSKQYSERRPILFSLHDGRQVKGFPLGWSDEWRVALAKIENGGNYPYVKIAKQPKLKASQICVALEFAQLIEGQQRESKPHMQIGCLTSVAPRNWFRTTCQVDEFPPIFDLEGGLIGMMTVKPFQEPRSPAVRYGPASADQFVLVGWRVGWQDSSRRH